MDSQPLGFQTWKACRLRVHLTRDIAPYCYSSPADSLEAAIAYSDQSDVSSDRSAIKQPAQLYLYSFLPDSELL
jgi:hypothetical protein